MGARSLLLLMMLTLFGCSFQSDTEAFYLDGAVHRVQLETVGGDVTIVANPRGELGVEAALTWVGARPRIDAQLRGGVLRVKSPCLERGEEPCRVNFTIQVPEGVDGRVVTRSGDLSLKGELGPVSFQTRSGTLLPRE